MITGKGSPVTVAAHGYGASLAETRPLLTGVPGTKVFFQARSHGDAPAAERPGYGELADDLRRIADEHGATQAFGVSMGGHTILRLLSQTPDRFERVVLFLPAAIDTPLAPRQDGSLTEEEQVRSELPAGAEGLEPYVRARAAFIRASPGLPAFRDAIAADIPVGSREVLRAVTAEVLVLGQEGDPLHLAQVARELADVLPGARLHVFAEPGAAFRERALLRELVVSGLS